MSGEPLPNGIPTQGDADSTDDDEPIPPIVKRVTRVEPRAVIFRKETFWDKAEPGIMTKAEVKKHFLHAAIRAGKLKDHNLLYEYSRIKATQIRLLIIEPAPTLERDLFVSLRKYNDKSVGAYPPGLQEYDALSYHWGPGPADRPVYLAGREKPTKIDMYELSLLKMYVPDFYKGRRFYVRPNLDRALRYLRHKTERTVLWVDAICINQSDATGEKPAQIAKMQRIYNKASNVCIWLGDGRSADHGDRSKDFHAAMEFSQKIVDLSDLEAITKNPEHTKSWSDLLDLIRCSWFSQRWVIQELALAREASVHVGEKVVSWRDFADAIALFALNFEKIRVLFKQSRDERALRNLNHFMELEPLGAKVLVDAITNTFRKNTDEGRFDPVSDLETLVSNLHSFESTDPRDTIFALLNIAKESLWSDDKLDVHGLLPPKPNYEKSILEVYIDFLEWVVFSKNSLDIICRRWAQAERSKPGGRKSSTSSMELPSWIQYLPPGYQEQSYNGPIYGGSIVGNTGRRRYNASHGKDPDVRFGKRGKPRQRLGKDSRALTAPGLLETAHLATDTASEEIGPPGRQTIAHKLYANGMVIGFVDWTSSPVSHGVITKDCLDKGGLTYSGEGRGHVCDKLWRTLVADRTADGENPPPWYPRAALHAVSYTDNTGHLAISELLDAEKAHYGTLPQIVVQYLKRVRSVTWERQFIEGNPQAADLEPLFGLAPSGTTKHDRICVLFGCSVPVILRPHFRESQLPEQREIEYYEFIGEAYIYGKMDGEAITVLKPDEIRGKTEEFLII